MRRPLLFFLSFWIFLLVGILPTDASLVHGGKSPSDCGKRVISSYSGGTSVQERAAVEPEDALANPDYDHYLNLIERYFGHDPLSGSNPYFSASGPYEDWARVAIRERMSDAERLAYINSHSTLEAEYIRGSDWGGGVGGILYTARGGVLSWAHYNGRGDVTVRSSATGAPTYATSYEAYGTRTQEAGANADRQRANTKDEDPTGLLNEGFRYWDLETGLFISRDPMGFVDGPNVYTYVRQNPWSAFDPEGLFELYVHTQGRIARVYPIGHVGVTTNTSQGPVHYDTGRYLGTYKGENITGPNLHVRSGAAEPPDASKNKEGFKSYKFVVDSKIDAAVAKAFQDKFDAGSTKLPDNISEKMPEDHRELESNQRYAGSDWKTFDTNCKSETFGTIVKSMRQIMNDNSVDQKIRDQAAAVSGMMEFTGKSLGQFGVKSTLDHITHGGKNVDFIQNKFTDRQPVRDLRAIKEIEPEQSTNQETE